MNTYFDRFGLIPSCMEERMKTIGQTFRFKQERLNTIPRAGLRCNNPDCKFLHISLINDKAFKVDTDGQAFDMNGSRAPEMDVVFLTEDELKEAGIEIPRFRSEGVEKMGIGELRSELARCYDILDRMNALGDQANNDFLFAQGTDNTAEGYPEDNLPVYFGSVITTAQKFTGVVPGKRGLQGEEDTRDPQFDDLDTLLGMIFGSIK